MSLLKFLILLILGNCFFSGPIVHADEKGVIRVGEFSRKKLENWVPRKFEGETKYSLALVDGEMALKAVSRGSASGLIKKIRVDIEKYPFLNWQWRIENRLSGRFDEKQKPGDDYAARIYIVVSGGFAVWKTIALNYVWAKTSRKGETWPNAFAEKNAVMTALQSSESLVSVWYAEKRNVKKDFQRLFGRDIRFIDAVVLMSDTDNTRNEVTAYYGDIYFSAR